MGSDTRDGARDESASHEGQQTTRGNTSRRPRLAVPRALWRMLRPDQVGLIFLLYGIGCVVALATTRATLRGVWPQVGGGTVALAVTTATVHYANEYADYETDAIVASSAFSGGSGALHDYGLPRSLARRATVLTGVATLPAGVVAWLSGVPPRALAVLVAVLLLGWQYSLPPLALAWRGLGTPTNALVGALLLPVYAVSVVTPPTVTHVAVFLPFTIVTTLSLLTTHWPDREGDAVVGKRTLATRLTPRRLRQLFLVVAAGYLVSVAVVAASVPLPQTVVAAYLVPLPAIVWGTRTFTRQESPLPGVVGMGSLAGALAVAWTLESGVV